MTQLFQLPFTKPLDSSVSPLAGAKLTFTATGTSTPQNVYQDAALTTPHANPVVADSDGVFPKIYLDPTGPDYRVKLTDAADVQQWQVDDYPASVVSAAEVGLALYPQSAEETAAGVTVTDYTRRPGNPMRYENAAGDGSTDDTAAVRAAFAVAALMPAGQRIVEITEDHVTDTIVLDFSHGRVCGGGTLRAVSTIPASGAIICSLAGGTDAVTNQALLDAVYGASVVLVRTNDTGSLENLRIQNIRFVPNGNAIKAIWISGFTRGCSVDDCSFDGFDDDAIAINGSWSFRLMGNNILGDGTNGVGIGLGRTSHGVRQASSVCNEVTLLNNTCRSCDIGILWNFGAGGSVIGNTCEDCATDGFQAQSIDGVSFHGNYFEDNAGDNMQLGGTNSSDVCTGLTVTGNHFANSSGGGNNIRLNGVSGSMFGFNNFSGTRTERFIVNSTGGGDPKNNVFVVPDVTSDYFSNVGSLDLDTNEFIRTVDMTHQHVNLRVRGTSALVGKVTVTGEIELDGAFNHDGASFGALGVAPATQAAKITDPSGGSTQDAEARAAINAIIDVLERFGFSATA